MLGDCLVAKLVLTTHSRLLDSRIDAMQVAMSRTSWSSVVFTSMPLTAGVYAYVAMLMSNCQDLARDILMKTCVSVCMYVTYVREKCASSELFTCMARQRSPPNSSAVQR
jgi:hypothetical protein